MAYYTDGHLVRIITPQEKAYRKAIFFLILGVCFVIAFSIPMITTPGLFGTTTTIFFSIFIAGGVISLVVGGVTLKKYYQLRAMPGNAIPQQSPQPYNIQHAYPQQQTAPQAYNNQQPYPHQQYQMPPETFADQQPYPQQTYSNQQAYDSNLTSSHQQVNSVFADNPPPYEIASPAGYSIQGPSSENKAFVEEQEDSFKNNDQVNNKGASSLPSAPEEAIPPKHSP